MTEKAAFEARQLKALTSVQAAHYPPSRASPAKHEVQSLAVPPEHVLQLESQIVKIPPTILYPASALVQETAPDTVTEHAAHPVGH